MPGQTYVSSNSIDMEACMIGEFFFLASIIGLVFINNMFSISRNNMMFIDRNTGLLNSNEDRWIRLLEMQQGQTRARKKSNIFGLYASSVPSIGARNHIYLAS